MKNKYSFEQQRKAAFEYFRKLDYIKRLSENKVNQVFDDTTNEIVKYIHPNDLVMFKEEYEHKF